MHTRTQTDRQGDKGKVRERGRHKHTQMGRERETGEKRASEVRPMARNTRSSQSAWPQAPPGGWGRMEAAALEVEKGHKRVRALGKAWQMTVLERIGSTDP